MPLKSWKDLIADSGGAGGNFEPLPDGDYDFVVIDCEAKPTAKGKTMYVTKNQVEAGPHKGRLVWHQHVISPESPNALSWFFRNMKVLGLPQEFFLADPAEHQVAEALKEKRFRGQVTTRNWQGTDKNEIKQFFTARADVSQPVVPSGGPAPAPAPQAAPAPSGPPAAPAPAPAPAYAAPASAPEAAPPPPPAAEAPPAPPVQQSVAPPPPPAAAPPAAPPLPAPTVAEAATPAGVPTPPADAPF